MSTEIVTHCLAIWHTYSNQLEQKDKDFFDEQVAQALRESTGEVAATQQVIQKRLQQEGYTELEAQAIAKRLVHEHIQSLTPVVEQPVQLSTPTA